MTEGPTLTSELEYVDHCGDMLDVATYSDGDVMVGDVCLTRDQVLNLYHGLGDHLMATAEPNTHDHLCSVDCTPADLPDATADGYDWPALAPDDTDSPTATSVLLEAQRAVYGPREADYGHPREDFTRQAILWTGLLQHKLQDGAYIEAEDIARCMVAVKLARDVHTPKRDNRVDGAGYFLTLDRLETGK